MKYTVKLMLLSLSVFTVSIFAQDEVIKEDVATSYETTDPAGNRVTVFIDPPNPKTAYEPWYDEKSPFFRGFDEVDEFEKFPPEATYNAVTVPVYAVADEEYRAKYSNWQSRLTQIIEDADNAYWRDFRINWVIQGHYSWTSNGNNASQILADLATDGAGLPDGLVIAFSADPKFNAGGIAYVYPSNPGTGFSVCLDQGIASTTSALRHEIGHNYGCSHDFDPVVCLMNYTYSYSIDYFDPSHDSLIQGRDHWFQ